MAVNHPVNGRRHLRPPITGNGGGGRLSHRGRPKGVPNKTTRILKHATILAATIVGLPEVETNQKGEITKMKATGRDGLLGYLVHIALTEPKTFTSALLGRILPLQIMAGEDDSEIDTTYSTVDEVREALAERGIPVDRVLPMLLEPPKKKQKQ